MRPFKVGDVVEPRPIWRKPAGIVPRGRVLEVVKWGDSQVLYLDGHDRRPFASYVFQFARRRKK